MKARTAFGTVRPMSTQAALQTSEDPVPAPSPAPRAAEESRVTPMMAQYVEIKSANPDSLLFYRMGDFYELFFDDAEIASRALGIVLTKRGKHLGRDIPMCGVPVERADDYLQRLIGLGHRVAVCEQTEDPAEARRRGSKSVVRRDVVRLVTPGTITEDRLLDPGRANLFVALARRRISDAAWIYGLAAVDISTGRFSVGEAEGAGLSAEIARLDPREILVPDAILDDPELSPLWRETAAAVTPLPRDGFDPVSAERRLREHFGVSTLDAFGTFSRAEIPLPGARSTTSRRPSSTAARSCSRPPGRRPARSSRSTPRPARTWS
jgi:DNA mismatch repair protein MutS